jgi:hypothetical protein
MLRRSALSAMLQGIARMYDFPSITGCLILAMSLQSVRIIADGLQASTLPQSRTRALSNQKLIGCDHDVLRWRNASNRHPQIAPQTCFVNSSLESLRRVHKIRVLSLCRPQRLKPTRREAACSLTQTGQAGTWARPQAPPSWIISSTSCLH